MITVAHRFRTRPIDVEALQFTGAESVPALQAWLAPISPFYRPLVPGAHDRSETLTVPVFDAVNTATYPTLGRQYKEARVALGCWVVRDSLGDLHVLTDQEMQAGYVALAGSGPETLLSDEGRREFVAGLTAHMREGGPAPGDDVDPTGVVPGVPVVDDPTARTVLDELHAAQATQATQADDDDDDSML